MGQAFQPAHHGGERRLDVGDFASYGRAFVRAMLREPQYGPEFRRYLSDLLAHLEDERNPDPDLP